MESFDFFYLKWPIRFSQKEYRWALQFTFLTTPFLNEMNGSTFKSVELIC